MSWHTQSCPLCPAVASCRRFSARPWRGSTLQPHHHAPRLPAPLHTSTTTAVMPETDKRAAAQQAVDILHEISTILVRFSPAAAPPPPRSRDAERLTRSLTLQNCHLDRKTLSICIALIERGVNPEALAVCPSPFYYREK